MMHVPGNNSDIPSRGPQARSREPFLEPARARNKGADRIDIRAALREAIARLGAAQVPSHTLAAELLLLHSLGRDRTWLYTHPEALLEPETAEAYFLLVARRCAGEPTQYINGKQEFWGLEFEVTRAVLIPRPETEHLMEISLERLGARGAKIGLDTGVRSAQLRIADVGTGSGCLAIALAQEYPHAEIFATDISAAALEVASRNAARHGVARRIHFLQTDLLEALSAGSHVSSHASAPFDLIVSNPPYVSRDEAATLPREVREYEPHTALFGGPRGTEIYAQIIGQARFLLAPGGLLVLELGYNSADRVWAILADEPGWTSIRITADLAGIPRVCAAERV
jgi:release factor glutamine methyltransferase